jgi:hypothetical protein
LTEISTKIKNNIFLVFSTTIALLVFMFQLESLNSKSYIYKQADYFKIDSVKMLTRAFIISVGGKSSSKSIEFEDENRKTFSISSSRYSALSNKSKLYDTLQYSSLVMSVLTDKAGYDNYYNKNNSDKIEVYDIQIGGMSFINLAEINNKEYDNRLSTIFFISIVYGACLIFYFYKRLKK